MLKKIFILILKYIPIMQMVGMLVGNTLCYFKIQSIYFNLIDFIVSNNITIITFLYVCSYVFKFCNWHRYIITANLTNICIVEYDILFTIPISNYQLLLSYYIIATIFSILAIYSKFHCNHVKSNEIIN